MAEAVDPPFDRPDRDFNSLPGWTWVGTYGGYYLQCDRLSDFEHGFFTRLWHGRGPEVLAAYVSAGTSVHRLRQVHSARVLPASQATAEPWPEADGLVSDAGGQSLWACGADCTPVLLADPVTGRVAACHAGWRGVAGGILGAAVQQLEASGSHRAHLLVALGPAISGSRYQVERRVSEQVAASLEPSTNPGQRPALLAELLAELRRHGALLGDADPNRDRLDIRAAARRQLERLGVAADRISTCPACTADEPLLFHSWRRDQIKAVQWSGIVSQA